MRGQRVFSESGFMFSLIERLPQGARRILAVLKETVRQWAKERAPRMAASLAFYTAFSLAPLLIIAVAIAGLVYGPEAARAKIAGEVQGLIGATGARTVQEVMDNAASKPSSGQIAAVVGIATLIFGATGVVGELQDSLNTIWNVRQHRKRGLRAIVKTRFLSFAMVLGIGFLLLVSLLLSTLLSAATAYAGRVLRSTEPVAHVVDFCFSFAVITVLFALLYKFLPDVEISWGDVWAGAASASGLFAVGKFALSSYIAHSGFESTYGAAVSLVVLLLWVYYSAQILLFGAELTQVFTTSRRPVAASRGAIKNVPLEKRNPLRPRAGEARRT